jgi:hypothetical protein
VRPTDHNQTLTTQLTSHFYDLDSRATHLIVNVPFLARPSDIFKPFFLAN